MGNNKFKLSDMIPNAWFYKLRDMGKNNRYKNKNNPQATSSSSSSQSNSSSLFSSTNSNSSSIPHKQKQPQISHHRQSYHFTRDLSTPHCWSPILETKLPNSPNESPKTKIRMKASFGKLLNSPNPASSNSRKSFFKSVDTNFDRLSPVLEKISQISPDRSPKLKIRSRVNRARPDKPVSRIPILSNSKNSFCTTKLPNSPNLSPRQRVRSQMICDKPKSRIPAGDFYQNLKTQIPPIITKKKKEAKKEKKLNAPRKQRNSTGVKLRTNSPRIGKIDENGRKSFSSGRKKPESFAVVKSSSRPHEDFRESMVEMILENNINGSKELEDLLACYLQLNCDEYHEVIIKVFKQIWFDLANVRA